MMSRFNKLVKVVLSSEATPRHTIYTRRPPGSGGGATSGVPRSPEFENIRAGSWDTHNPACAELPHALVLFLVPPPAERLFQKKRNRFDLLEDHIHDGVNFFATSQEIVREWRLMGEDTLEFENAKKAFVEEREKFNAERQGFAMEIGAANSTRCYCEVVGEKAKISDEVEQERVASQKREEEYLQRIAKLEKVAEEKVAECKASEFLAEEVSADCKWLLSRAVPLISECIVKSHELTNYMFELGQAVYNSGRKDGYSEGRAAATNNEKDYHFDLYKEDCGAVYAAKRRDYEFVEFGIVKAVDKLSRRANAIEVLKKALGDEGHETGGAGTSHHIEEFRRARHVWAS
ncbi:hypothetical protein Hanom_Chr00s001272g01678281 [Helianthus anomalus]